jgi:hypothetical protein
VRLDHLLSMELKKQEALNIFESTTGQTLTLFSFERMSFVLSCTAL